MALTLPKQNARHKHTARLLLSPLVLISGRNGLPFARSRATSTRFSAMRRSAFSVLAATLAVLSLGTSACRRDEIRTYTVKKEASSPVAPASPSPMMPGAMPAVSGPGANATMANTRVDTASGPALAWDVPAGWSAGPERPMRKATLLIPGEAGGAGAELSVTAFPGDVGGNLANVNRWRQQLSLAPIGEAELGAALQHLDVGALHVDLVELTGPSKPPAAPQRVLGAIVPYSGATWFFKFTGPDALVSRERETFLVFIRSLRPQG